MNFNSVEFLVFLPVVVTVYWVIPHSTRWVWLLAASYYFYIQWNSSLLLLILAVTALSHCMALRIEETGKSAWKKFYLFLDVFVCLGILVYFKYIKFLLDSVASVLSLFCAAGIQVDAFEVVLPIGISFYTFQALSYVVDVYRGKIPAEKHLGYFSLYVVFFPQLVAGPIEAAGNLLPQLKRRNFFSMENLTTGGRIMLCGFFRKCVVADFCGVYVDNVFSNLPSAGPVAVFAAGGLFCVQMYCDFAGYSEIAQGAAKMMGIDLMENFNRPYLSTSYTEFFRRWHISLNRWFVEYVYIPLGGSRRGKARKAVNTVIVFALCGLWHGPSWTYVCWGLYAAIFVCVEDLFQEKIEMLFGALGQHFEQPFVTMLRRCVMFLIFVPAALLFRSPSIDVAGQVLLKLFHWPMTGDFGLLPALQTLGLDGAGCLQLALRLVCMCQLYAFGKTGDAGHGETQRIRDSTYIQGLTTAVYLVLTIFLCWVSFASTEGVSRFAYFQF